MKLILYNDQQWDNNKHLVSVKTKEIYPKTIDELKTSLVGERVERVEINISVTKNNLVDIFEFLNYSKPCFK